MAVYVSEHSGQNNYRQPINQSPLAQYSVSTLAAGPAMQAGTRYIRVTADSGSLMNLSTLSTTTTLTSTNCFRISANAPGELFSVSTAFRVQAQST